MVRKFKLINEKGQEFSLMNIHEACLLTDPSGLGYEYDTGYQQLGNTFVQTVRNITQGKIEGTANFLSYTNYKKFVDFIEDSNSLKFSYKVPLDGVLKEFLKDVEIQSLGKSEIQLNGIISESIVFNCLTLWYEENTTVYTIVPQTNEIHWNFRWDSRFTDYDLRRLSYINKGHVEAPILIEIDGHVVNPEIQLYVEGELYQTVKITADIAQYEKLLYGTKENDFYINKQNTDGTLTSLFDLDHINFENDNVIRIPKNRSCELRLTADNEVLNAKVTILPQYKAV